ncbi:hypothetical protein B0H66DRAFT_608083 [Apodospora peruviana]|uniref:Uncharacterized protein n=1 Tax=Apodospora peruviana TaxID=516989 RepID=A0AAE0LZW5_9PEZI|nr:hypothetical protein B0H66DRAFT_608083 [Apodospora peruviana]
MGQNLSSKVVVDTSKAVLNSTDRQADIILGIIWILCVYGLGAICRLSLIDNVAARPRLHVGVSRQQQFTEVIRERRRRGHASDQDIMSNRGWSTAALTRDLGTGKMDGQDDSKSPPRPAEEDT